MIKHKVQAALATLCAFAAMAPAAFASDGTQVTVTGGDLSISNPAASNFAPVTLDGHSTTTNATLAPFAVTDARGSGAGWFVTAQADQFTSGGHDLALGSLLMSEPTVGSPSTSSPD